MNPDLWPQWVQMLTGMGVVLGVILSGGVVATIAGWIGQRDSRRRDRAAR